MAGDSGGETILPLLLGRYRVDGMLGEGGLGTVVRAFDTRLKRTVAIKTLKRSSYTLDPDLFRALEERFAREAEAGSRMGSHPNLVTVYDLVMDADRTQYLILEYVPGGTLADRITPGPLPLADALRLTADAARGLMAAHDRGIIHRDVKPANIFLGEDGRAQVGDFGIAQIDELSRRTHSTATHPGTPLYMSPEQAHSTGYVRASSDQYSLGLVLFELLTGQAYKRLEKHEADTLLAQQPTTVAALVNRMLAPEPGDRYPGMTALLAAIQAIATMPAEARSTNPPTVLAPPRNDAITHPQPTPAINLQPVPPVLDRPLASPAVPSVPHYSRRAILIGAGGLVIAAGVGGAAMAGFRGMGGASPSVAAPAPTVALAAISALPTVSAIPTATPTAPPVAAASLAAVTSPPIVVTSPPIVVTAPPPIVITAPPVVVTATPTPTATPTATATPVIADERDAASGVLASYFSAVNRRDFRAAYALLGADLQQRQSYTAFAAVFNTAARDDLDILSVTDAGAGRYTIAARFTSYQTNGSVQHYAGTYTIGRESRALKILSWNLTGG